MWKMTRSKTSRRHPGRKSGKFRSKFEAETAKWLDANGHPYIYEGKSFSFIQPAKKRSYTPDFLVRGVSFVIETKGIFTLADRQKHLWLREQGGPEVRFVFYNAWNRICKGSKTTYAMWCEKNGFIYSHKIIPEEWFNNGS